MKYAGDLEFKEMEIDVKVERTKDSLFIVHVGGSVTRIGWDVE